MAVQHAFFKWGSNFAYIAVSLTRLIWFFFLFYRQAHPVAWCDHHAAEVPEAKTRQVRNKVRSDVTRKRISLLVSHPPIKPNQYAIRPESKTKTTTVITTIPHPTRAERKKSLFRKIRFASRSPKLCSSTPPWCRVRVKIPSRILESRHVYQLQCPFSGRSTWPS